VKRRPDRKYTNCDAPPMLALRRQMGALHYLGQPILRPPGASTVNCCQIQYAFARLLCQWKWDVGLQRMKTAVKMIARNAFRCGVPRRDGLRRIGLGIDRIGILPSARRQRR